jgi:hypothetical protein
MEEDWKKEVTSLRALAIDTIYIIFFLMFRENKNKK